MVGYNRKLTFIPRMDNRGALRVWQEPVFGHRYAIGGDTATGQDVNLKLGQADPDFSYAVVLDVDSREQVASIRERMTPGEFAAYLCDVGEWYNWAMMAIESNGIGLSTIEQVMGFSYPVDRLYCMRRHPNEVGRPPVLQEIGWSTSSSTKPLLISRVQEALRQRHVHIRDAIIIQELMTYVYLGANKSGGRPGCHDDGVIALGLAIIALESAIMVEAEIAGRRQIEEDQEIGDVTYYKRRRWR